MLRRIEELSISSNSKVSFHYFTFLSVKLSVNKKFIRDYEYAHFFVHFLIGAITDPRYTKSSKDKL